MENENDKFDHDLAEMLFFGFRYALDRQTTSVSIAADFLIKHWAKFSPDDQRQCKREIERKFRMMEKSDNPYWRENKLDWQKVLNLEITEDENA